MRTWRSLAELAATATLALALAAPAAAQDPPTGPVPKTPENVNGKTPPDDQFQPPAPGKMKAIARKVQKNPLVQRLRNHDDGFHPRAFSITTGASWSAGVGYRRHVLDDRAIFRAGGELSIRGYRVVESSVEFPALPRRLYVRGDVRYRHFPQEDFFGVGGASREPLRSTYRLRTGEVWGTGGIRLGRTMIAGTELGWMHVNVGRGTDRKYPSIEDLFTDESAPGLSDQPNYLRTGLFWDWDRRDQPGYPRAGSRYRVTLNDYADLTFSRYGFRRFDAEASTYLPSLRAGDVIALRGRVTYSNNKTGHVVPFYMLPTMGGGSSLRAFDEFRYRDENALLVNAEYRVPVHKYLDVAVFGDAGKVALDYQGINPKGLIANYGIGLRLHTASRLIFRFDVAHGREGTRFLTKVNQPF